MTRVEKKQIPRKVLYEDIGYNQYQNVNMYACICPSCGLHIIEFDDDNIPDDDEPDGNVKRMFHANFVHHDYRGLNNYCNRCGQKLDWR